MDFESRHFKSIDLKSKSKSKSKYPNKTIGWVFNSFYVFRIAHDFMNTTISTPQARTDNSCSSLEKLLRSLK